MFKKSFILGFAAAMILSNISFAQEAYQDSIPSCTGVLMKHLDFSAAESYCTKNSSVEFQTCFEKYKPSISYADPTARLCQNSLALRNNDSLPACIVKLTPLSDMSAAESLCTKHSGSELLECAAKYATPPYTRGMLEECASSVSQGLGDVIPSCIKNLDGIMEFSQARHFCNKDTTPAFQACVQIAKPKLGAFNAATFCLKAANQQFVSCFENLSLSLMPFDAASSCLKNSDPLNTACVTTLTTYTNRKCHYYDKYTGPCIDEFMTDGFAFDVRNLKKEEQQGATNWRLVGDAAAKFCNTSDDSFRRCVIENEPRFETWSKKMPSVRTYCGASAEVRKCIDENKALIERAPRSDFVVRLCEKEVTRKPKTK